MIRRSILFSAASTVAVSGAAMTRAGLGMTTTAMTTMPFRAGTG
ncbi:MULTISPECIES: hypothetical protein [unclassified Brevundimonas]|nr:MULTISPECIES: hypothetical protein [unclassified Brevundimonas]